MTNRNPVIGTWEILEMDSWDKSTLDLIEPAFLLFEPGRTGALGFIAVRGGIDYRVLTRDGKPAVEFSWEGLDEGRARCGRAWAVVDGDGMTGHFFIHAGDDSPFRARRAR